MVGPSNQFTHAACISIANNPGENYNPLFIFGGVGLGKTHLLQAIGIESLRQRPEARVVTLSSEEFMNQLITSLRQKEHELSFGRSSATTATCCSSTTSSSSAARTPPRRSSSTRSTRCITAAKQIVITSDKSPKELPGIEERLRVDSPGV